MRFLRVPVRLCVSFSLVLSFSSFRLSLSIEDPDIVGTVNLLFVFTSLLPYFYASPMFSKPRQLDIEAELYDVAVRALMRSAHTVHEMKQKLERMSYNKLHVHE